MIRVYTTYCGTRDTKPQNATPTHGGLIKLIWKDVVDDSGEKIIGTFLSNNTKIFKNLKIGNRYIIECGELGVNHIKAPKSIKWTNKNPKCGLIRKAFGDYTFIKGKYKGRWVKNMSEIELCGLHEYLLWLAENTNNEATVINSLCILKKINNE